MWSVALDVPTATAGRIELYLVYKLAGQVDFLLMRQQCICKHSCKASYGEGTLVAVVAGRGT